MVHLSMLQQKIRQKQIDWTVRAGSFSQKRLKWVWFYLKVGVASKIFMRTLHTTVLLWNPPPENPGSATVNQVGYS